MEFALQWIIKNPNSVHTSILISTVSNHYVRQTHHTTIEPPPLINAYHRFHQPSSYNGCEDTPTSLAMTLQTGQQKKTPQLIQIPSALYQFHAPFKSSTSFSATIFLLMSKQAKFTYIETSNDLQQLQSCRDDVLIARLHSGHQLSLKTHHHRIDPEIEPKCPSCQQAITHYNIGLPSIRQEILFDKECLGTTKGH